MRGEHKYKNKRKCNGDEEDTREREKNAIREQIGREATAITKYKALQRIKSMHTQRAAIVRGIYAHEAEKSIVVEADPAGYNNGTGSRIIKTERVCV